MKKKNDTGHVKIRTFLSIIIALSLCANVFIIGLYGASSTSIETHRTNFTPGGNNNQYNFSQCTAPSIYPIINKIEPEHPTIKVMANEFDIFIGKNNTTRLLWIAQYFFNWKHKNIKYVNSPNIVKSIDEYIISEEGDCSESARTLTSILINKGYDAYTAIAINNETGHEFVVVFMNNTAYTFSEMEKTDKLIYLFNNEVKYKCYNREISDTIYENLKERIRRTI